MPQIAHAQLNDALRNARPRVEKVVLGPDYLVTVDHSFHALDTLKECYSNGRKIFYYLFYFALGTPEVVHTNPILQFHSLAVNMLNVIGKQHPQFCAETTFNSVCFQFCQVIEVRIIYFDSLKWWRYRPDILDKHESMQC